jgi:hypothetical protein
VTVDKNPALLPGLTYPETLLSERSDQNPEGVGSDDEFNASPNANYGSSFGGSTVSGFGYGDVDSLNLNLLRSASSWSDDIRFDGGQISRATDVRAVVAPKGGEFTFIGGAGVQGEYLEGFEQAFKDIGFKGVKVVNAGKSGDGLMGLAADVASVTSINDLEFANSLIGSRVINFAARYSLDLHYRGEQYNLGGYSYGSAAAASIAYAIAQSGGYVDNLVLVGAPINKDLYYAVSNNPRIANVINVDLSFRGDPIRAGMSDLSIVSTLPTLLDQMPKNQGHFYYSGTGKVADQRRSSLAQYLYTQGVK